jgi:hypothetical protein
MWVHHLSVREQWLSTVAAVGVGIVTTVIMLALEVPDAVLCGVSVPVSACAPGWLEFSIRRLYGFERDSLTGILIRHAVRLWVAMAVLVGWAWSAASMPKWWFLGGFFAATLIALTVETVQSYSRLVQRPSINS